MDNNAKVEFCDFQNTLLANPDRKKGHHFEKASMNAKLNHIAKWPELTGKARWSAYELAEKCGVSVRTLERYFLESQNKTPKHWLTERRQLQAHRLLSDGFSIKETASQLDYKYSHHFSREFKQHWGICPSQVNSSAAGTDRFNVSDNDCRDLV
jgi:AraC-like DNA-binding protein